jgi:hypothetical protein
MVDRAQSANGLIGVLSFWPVTVLVFLGIVYVILVMTIAHKHGKPLAEIRFSLIPLSFQVKFQPASQDQKPEGEAPPAMDQRRPIKGD